MKYKEILELQKFCEKNGIQTEAIPIYDGLALRFNNGGDVVQHYKSYGSSVGCVEFGYTGLKEDFKATKLLTAKRLANKNKNILNGSARKKNA